MLVSVEQIKTSVLMAVYAGDSPAALEEALGSILNQSRPADEIIVVEDGPIPNSLTRHLDEAATRHSGLRRHRLPENLGFVAALNEGLGRCRGEFIFRMDADDVAMRERFEKQLAFMEANPDVGVLGTATLEFIDHPDRPMRIKPVPETHKAIRDAMPWRNPINHPTVCLRRATLPESGYPDLQYVEDYFLWAILAAQGTRFHNLTEPLLAYRFNNATLARRSGWRNFRNEMALRRWMYERELISLPTLLATGVVQALARFSPAFIQRLLWRWTRRRAS